MNTEAQELLALAEQPREQIEIIRGMDSGAKALPVLYDELAKQYRAVASAMRPKRKKVAK